MNTLGKGLNARVRRGKRGVSPIIATILLVAITVVLAAVLYVLISGLTGGGVSSPYSLQMTNDGQTVPAAGTYYITLALNPTSGLTTGFFGLKVTNVSSATVNGAAVPTTTCKLYATFGSTACPKATAASTAWYVVLVAENGTVANSYGTAGWSAPTVAVTGAETLVVVTGASITSIDDTLSAFSTGSASVSGSVSL